MVNLSNNSFLSSKQTSKFYVHIFLSNSIAKVHSLVVRSAITVVLFVFFIVAKPKNYTVF